jgi:acyl-CoA thioester hydrolase
MTTEPGVTHLEIVPAPNDLNHEGMVDGPAYLRWVQTVVIAHWERLAPDAALKSTQWIAVRHCVRHRAPSRAGEHLVASTRITRLGGVRAAFSTIISRRAVVIVEVDSIWVCLDSATGKPKTIEADVRAAFGL